MNAHLPLPFLPFSFILNLDLGYIVVDWIRLVTGLAQISRNVPTGRGDGTPKNKYRLEIKIRRDREK